MCVCVCVCGFFFFSVYVNACVWSPGLDGSCNFVCCVFVIVGKECVSPCSCINGLLFCKPLTICGVTEMGSCVLQLVLVILRLCTLVSEMEF